MTWVTDPLSNGEEGVEPSIVLEEGSKMALDLVYRKLLAFVGLMLVAPTLTAQPVGVIPEAGFNCPSGMARITLFLDNEDDDNANSRMGWIGATEQDRDNTLLHFCRADGALFRPVASGKAESNYAVLALGATCPSGSVSLTRHFDNEDHPGCSFPAACALANNNLDLRLCMFRASERTGSTAPFPSIGIPYGVFGTASLPGSSGSGFIFTDDEDDDNHNSLSGDTAGSEVFLSVGRNTLLRMVRVTTCQ